MEEVTNPFIPCQLFSSNEKGLQLNKLRTTIVRVLLRETHKATTMAETHFLAAGR